MSGGRLARLVVAAVNSPYVHGAVGFLLVHRALDTLNHDLEDLVTRRRQLRTELLDEPDNDDGVEAPEHAIIQCDDSTCSICGSGG